MAKNEAKSTPGAPEWYVYLVRCADDSLYCGIAKDVAARIKVHNQGKGARYTRSRGPVMLAWHTTSPADHGSALRLERQIKRLSRGSKLALCSGKQTLQE